MDKEFCNAIVSNDRKSLEKNVNEFLRKLDSKDKELENFNKIKLWFESHDCVQSVKISSGMMDVEPPVKEFVISLKGSPINTIGIEVKEGKMRFNI